MSLATLIGCGSAHEPRQEKTGTTSEAVTTIQIAGQIVDANGLPRPGVTVTLAGSADLTRLSDANGDYAFTGLVPGSYSVRPTFNQCFFQPDVVNLNNLSASVTQNFNGSGSGCGGSPTVGSGATTGSLTVSGTLTDTSGNAVVGAELTLAGNGSGIRFTDFTGAYSFSVNPGTYSLTTSGACSFNPSNANLNNITANATQNFIATTTGCIASTVVSQNPTGSVLNVSQAGQPLGTVFAHVEQRASAANALVRLQQIVAEQPVMPVSLTIAGSPAIERQTVIPSSGLLDPELPGAEANPGPPPISLTAAIAIGSQLVRFESQLPSTATAAVIAAFFRADRNLAPSTLTRIQGPAFGTAPLAPHISPVPPTPPLPTTPLLPSTVNLQEGELQIAASDTVNAVVYGLQRSVFYSNNGGNTVLASALNVVNPPPLTNGGLIGDPSVGVGAPNGVGQNFWYSIVERSNTLTGTGFPPGGLGITAIGLYKSTDNGVTFNAAPNAFPVNCSSASTMTMPQCAATDEPQLAVDRATQALDSNGLRRDSLYMAWRNFIPNGTGTGSGYVWNGTYVACSFDEQNWNVDSTTLVATGADWPRLNVAPDGSLLVAYQIRQPSGNYQLAVQKFSSCQSHFVPQFGQGFPSFIPAPANAASFVPVPDLAGLDRPAASNHSIAADTTDSMGHRVFATYASQTGTGTNVHVAESFDGAQTWTGGANDVIVNSVSTGARFFPSICTTGGTAFVSWYDRRAASAAQPDLTAYVRSSVVDSANGLVPALPDINVSGINDEECSSGFPGATSGATEELLCGTQDLPGSATDPILSGTCACASGAPAPCGGQACDQRFPTTGPDACPANQTCAAGGGGDPKYGDYNGNACALGRLFMAWASSTPPPGACATGNAACSATFPACPGLACIGGMALLNMTCISQGGACTVAASGANACCSGVCEANVCLPAIGVYTNSTTCTANCPVAPLPVIPQRRSYAAYECTRGAQLPLPYSTSGAEVGNQGGDTAFCPLMNDSTVPLNSLPAPTVFLNGDFTIGTGLGGGGSVPITVEGCFIDSQTGSSMNCGVTTTMSNGSQQVRVDTTTWAGATDNDGFFIYVDVGNQNFATLWSYDTR